MGQSWWVFFSKIHIDDQKKLLENVFETKHFKKGK